MTEDPKPDVACVLPFERGSALAHLKTMGRFAPLAQRVEPSSKRDECRRLRSCGARQG